MRQEAGVGRKRHLLGLLWAEMAVDVGDLKRSTLRWAYFANLSFRLLPLSQKWGFLTQNRAGKNLPEAQRKRLERAKDELRVLYGRTPKT